MFAADHPSASRFREKLPAFSMRNASPHDLVTNIGQYKRPFAAHETGGIHRASSSDTPSDELNTYENWLETQANGQCQLNEFMSLSGAQQAVILNDYTAAYKQKLPYGAVADDLAIYAAQDKVLNVDTTTYLLDRASDQVTSLLGDDSTKYGKKWNSLTQAQQLSIAKKMMQWFQEDEKMDKSTLKDWIDKGVSNGGGGGDYEDLFIVAGVGAGALLGAYMLYVYLK